MIENFKAWTTEAYKDYEYILPVEFVKVKDSRTLLLNIDRGRMIDLNVSVRLPGLEGTDDNRVLAAIDYALKGSQQKGLFLTTKFKKDIWGNVIGDIILGGDRSKTFTTYLLKNKVVKNEDGIYVNIA